MRKLLMFIALSLWPWALAMFAVGVAANLMGYPARDWPSGAFNVVAVVVLAVVVAIKYLWQRSHPPVEEMPLVVDQRTYRRAQIIGWAVAFGVFVILYLLLSSRQHS